MQQAIESTRLPVFEFGDRRRCTYCGDPATARDHVIAVSYQQQTRTKAFSECGPWTWSCTECNTTLSNRWFDSFDERCRWVSWRLQKRVKPILWTEAQLARLDFKLQNHIRQQTAKAKWSRYRADFYESRDYYLNLESLTWELARRDTVTDARKFLAGYFRQTLIELAGLYKPAR
jgi:hypothetical protein